MKNEIKIEKSLNKNYYILKEEIKVTVLFKNLSNHALENLVYTEDLNENREIVDSKVLIDGFEIKLREGTQNINIGNLHRGEEKRLEFNLKLKAFEKSEKITLKGETKYYSYGDEREEFIEVETIVKGVNLKIEDFTRDSEVLFTEDNCTYKFKVKNSGNVVASNVLIRYLGNNSFRTVLDSVKIDDISYEDVYIEEGINIGSVFEGDFRVVEFKIKPKKTVSKNNMEHKIDVKYNFVVNPKDGIIIEEFNYPVEALKLINTDVKIEKTSDVMIINKESFGVITTTICNNSGVDILNFRLSEIFNNIVNISSVEMACNDEFVVEGTDILIAKISDGEEKKIEYKAKVSDETRDDFLEVYSKGIFNLGYSKWEKRFKVESERLSIELNINRLEIKSKVDKVEIGLDESFKREIKIKNTSNRKINRIRFYDKLSKGVVISKGTFTIDDKVINQLNNLNEGIDIGELDINKEMILSYQGELEEFLEDREVSIECYCDYNIKCDFTEEVSKSYTEKIKHSIKIDRIYKECIINKKIDIKNLCLREVQDITGQGKIENIISTRGVKEIKSEGRFIPCKNYIVEGRFEVNMEYISFANEGNKLFSLNIPIEFKETVEGKNENRNRNYANVNTKDIRYEILNGYLKVIILADLVLN